jgi:hypothetical protein
VICTDQDARTIRTNSQIAPSFSRYCLRLRPIEGTGFIRIFRRTSRCSQVAVPTSPHRGRHRTTSGCRERSRRAHQEKAESRTGSVRQVRPGPARILCPAQGTVSGAVRLALEIVVVHRIERTYEAACRAEIRSTPPCAARDLAREPGRQVAAQPQLPAQVSVLARAGARHGHPEVRRRRRGAGASTTARSGRGADQSGRTRLRRHGNIGRHVNRRCVEVMPARPVNRRQAGVRSSRNCHRQPRQHLVRRQQSKRLDLALRE